MLIVTQDFPDPDCIASSFGLPVLFAHWGIETSQITFGGFVGRAENRAMVRFCNIQAVSLMLIEFSDFDRIILVDSFPGEGNVSLGKEHAVDVVIDHHPHDPTKKVPFYTDIRDEIGSTSTIVALYLLSEECPINPQVATALFYGIKTDTNNLARHASPEDLECYKQLFNLIDHIALSNIEAPDRDAEYFRILHRSTESMTVYNETVGHIHLGVISTPDYIAEIADLFHSLENLEWMICSAIFKNQILFSIRSRKEETAGSNAEKIANKLHGYGGGHYTKAAGQIPINSESSESAVDKFINIFKSVIEIDKSVGHSILKNK